MADTRMDGLESWFSGPLLARMTGLYLRLAAIALGLAALLGSMVAWWFLLATSLAVLPPHLIVAATLAQLAIIVGVGLAMALLWRRGRVLSALSAERRPAPRVVAILLATAGDFGALSFVSSSLALGLLVAIAGDQLALLSPALTQLVAGYSPLLQALGFVFLGLAIVALGLSVAAACVLALRFFAETIMLGVQVAGDSHAIRLQLEDAGGPPQPTPRDNDNNTN
jgi:hypothetical protein